MATLEELDAHSATPDVAATVVAEAATVAPAEAASAGGELDQLDPELDTDYQVDPAYTTSKQFEEAAKKEKKDGAQTLKSAVIISGVAVAVIGVIFAVAKKIKEA